MKKIERKYFEVGDSVSLNHSFDLIMTHENYFEANKNCFIYDLTGDYYYLCKIENENKIHFLKTKKHLKNNIFYSKNLLIEKNKSINYFIKGY